jgi:predicted acylesterase/phospholipase RssA
VNPSRDLAGADYGSPGRSCDIVMKGGITSGVVYPHAVCELAQTYRFRNVGGTSAGAIAAAATAAAEYGRDAGGFNELAGLPDWLGADTNLRSLFQPQKKTRRLYAVLLAGIDRGPAGAIAAAVGEHLPMFAVGALPGLALTAVALVSAANAASTTLMILAVAAAVFAGLPLATLGASLAILARIGGEASRRIPDNGFGLCSGAASATFGGDSVALTPWLHKTINSYAGLPVDEPLTFGHLWAGPGKDRETASQKGEHVIELAMMTTNLVNRTARQLPWQDRDWFFSPDEFRQLFPEEVVTWMEAHSPDQKPYDGTPSARESRIRLALAREQGLLALPAAVDMPILVATRMSLSFPILLSAVPLWQIDVTRPENKALNTWRSWAKGQQFDPLDPVEDWPTEGRPDAKPVIERCWFSDGGISSNFPVHFFDSLVPRWPTFGLNLRPYAFGKEPDKTNEANNTWMVKSNNDGIAEWWYRFPEAGRGFKDKRLTAFLSSIVRTMQNRVDEAQMRVPGYRDRIAHVSMSDEEGGMNLTMPAERIEALTARGRAAARRLHDAYTQPEEKAGEIGWDNHRWVRLRSSLSVLEEMHAGFIDGFAGKPLNGERTYEELIERGRDASPRGYPFRPAGERQIAKQEIAGIAAAAAKGGLAGTVQTNTPRPEPVGRIVPRD